MPYMQMTSPLQSCGGCDSNRTPSECLNNTKANSASSKLGVHCVQPRAAHGSHTAFAAAHSGFTSRPAVVSRLSEALSRVAGVRPRRLEL
jgi:hypothetical protein